MTLPFPHTDGPERHAEVFRNDLDYLLAVMLSKLQPRGQGHDDGARAQQLHRLHTSRTGLT